MGNLNLLTSGGRKPVPFYGGVTPTPPNPLNPYHNVGAVYSAIMIVGRCFMYGRVSGKSRFFVAEINMIFRLPIPVT